MKLYSRHVPFQFIAGALFSSVLWRLYSARTEQANIELARLKTDLAAKRACELVGDCAKQVTQLDPYQVILLAFAVGFVVAVIVLYYAPRIKAHIDMWLDAKIEN